jgi:anionic cell wall polymer biosynthesis LytR-Cps2A-Psr (LCP) family protein
MKHQQQILLAMREKILQLNILPKLPQLSKQFADTVKTDLSLTELKKLADLARKIKAENITAYSLDTDYVTRAFVGEADVLVLNEEKASQLIQEIFCDARLQEEGAQAVC